jgi:hypothetical protein
MFASAIRMKQFSLSLYKLIVMESTSISNCSSAVANSYNPDTYPGQIQAKPVVNNQGKKMIEFISGRGKAEHDMGVAPLPPVWNTRQYNWCN